MDMSLSELREVVMDREAWCAAVPGVTKSRTWISDRNNKYLLECRLCEEAFLVAQLVKNPPAMQETLVWFLDQEDPLEKGKAAHSSILGFPGGSNGKESACSVGDLGSIPG